MYPEAEGGVGVAAEAEVCGCGGGSEGHCCCGVEDVDATVAVSVAAELSVGEVEVVSPPFVDVVGAFEVVPVGELIFCFLC